MSEGIYECVVCHRKFSLTEPRHYISKDPTPTGFAGIVGGVTKVYDTFDCPVCGCQNVMQVRKPYACPCDFGICDECDYCGDEDEDEGDEQNTIDWDSMITELTVYCSKHRCSTCKLKSFECGKGKWFDDGMTSDELILAYNIIKEDLK